MMETGCPELCCGWCRLSRVDPRAEPRVRERVPYVIVCGPPKATLISLVRQPQELLADAALRLNAIYYIRKQIIPPVRAHARLGFCGGATRARRAALDCLCGFRSWTGALGCWV